MANKSIKNPRDVSNERFSRLEEENVDINHNMNLLMQDLENKLGANEDGCSNSEVKLEGKLGEKDELKRESKKE